MNNDLISRKALIKAIEESEGTPWDSLYDFNLVCRKRLIDNAPAIVPIYYSNGTVDYAPTVSEITNEDIQQAIKEGFANGYEMAKAKHERPQGEWKITYGYPHKVYCDQCFKTYAQANWDIWKDGTLARDFCPNCGAKMKGGAE